MQNLYTDRTFLFIYDGIINNNPNPGYNIEEFW